MKTKASTTGYIVMMFLFVAMVIPSLATGATWAQQQELTASDGLPGDFFGASVTVSSDGSTALIGAFNAAVGTNGGQGVVYVFTRSGSTWTKQAEVTASDGATDDQFGLSVALSSDGNAALISAPGKNSNQGAAYVFTRSGSTWTQQQELTASDGVAFDAFGISVALSGNGNTALIGAEGKNSDQGAAYVFTRSGSIWTQQAELTATDGAADDSFGRAVAMSGDGSTAIVGAYIHTVGGNVEQGAAYVFTLSGSSWPLQAELTATDGAVLDAFGASVALNSNGNTALIGAPFKTIGTNYEQGAAYVFTRSGSIWTQQQELTASDGAADDNFSYISVSLSSDGGTALVSAPFKTVNSNIDQGTAYVFTFSGSTWTQQAELTASDGAANDQFSQSVSLSADGSTAFIGAYARNSYQGATYVFTSSTAVPFSTLNAKLRIFAGPPPSFTLNATFTLGAGSNGVSPLSEDVAIKVGTYSVTIPGGSFQQLKNGSKKGTYTFSGVIGGVTLSVQIAPPSVTGDGWSLKASGTPVDLTGLSNPITVTITIGDDSGTTAVNALFN